MLQAICSHSSANFEDMDKSTFVHHVVDICYKINCTPIKFELITDWMETMDIGGQIENIMTFTCDMCDINDDINDFDTRPMHAGTLSMHVKDKHNMERCQLCRMDRVSILTTHTIYTHCKLCTSFLSAMI